MAKTFELPPLKYAFNALEPAIDARTMEIHHDKHHAAYVTNLNKALESAPELYNRSVEDILRKISDVPEAIRTAVRNNGGGHANHTLFWEWLTPGGSKMPTGQVSREINSTFGAFDSFVEKFSTAAMTRFGSGWAWLVRDGGGKLQVYSHRQPGQPGDGRLHPAAGPGCVGARLLPELPEPPRRLRQGLLVRGQLGRGRRTV